MSLGTNTYIIGQQNPYTLIDVGEGRSEYIPVLEKALRETARPMNSNEPDVSDIILSHRHHDHIGGLPSVLALLRRLWDDRNSTTPFKPPRLHKFPLPPNTHDEKLHSVLDSLLPGSFTPNQDGSPFHNLHDSQIFSPAAPALDGSLSSMEVLHTPGHTFDSVCLYLHADHALFTADTILGQGTAVFEDLTAYFASLHKMIGYHRAQYDLAPGATQIKLLYPGHGPVVTDGIEVINTYIRHRLEREAQIIQVLKSPPTERPQEGQTSLSTAELDAWTTWSIVSNIYAGYPVSLWLPAARSVTLHLCKLEDDGLVRRLDGEGVNMKWELVSTS